MTDKVARTDLPRWFYRILVFAIMIIFTIVLLIEPVPRFFKPVFGYLADKLRLRRAVPWLRSRGFYFALAAFLVPAGIWFALESAQMWLLAHLFSSWLNAPLWLILHPLKWCVAFPALWIFQFYENALLSVHWFRICYEWVMWAACGFHQWLEGFEVYVQAREEAKLIKQTIGTASKEGSQAIRGVFTRHRFWHESRIIQTARRLRNWRVQRGHCIQTSG